MLYAGAVSSPTGLITLVSFLSENLLPHSSYLPLGVSQRTCDMHVLVAHKLARFAYDSDSSFVWDGHLPSFIIPDVINDVTLFEL